MNDLGMLLVWSVIQVTVFLIPASGLHLFVSRRSPSAGAWLATCALVITLVISVVPLIPLSVNEDCRRPAEPAVGALARSFGPLSTAEPASGHPENLPAASAIDPASFDFARAFGRFVGAWGNLALGPIVPPVRFRRWGALIATIGIAGAIAGLTRVFIGLWAIRLCRRRGRVIGDPPILDLLDEVRRAMDCDQQVEIREVPDLTAPATAGWRHPMILLPAGWRGWNDADLRAVLAHELAHIHRSDYAAGLVARLALAFQFYHPLVHWLTKRLILQQELAADAVGARLAGGTDSYLRSLSRLALEQDTPPAYSPARAFLPSRGTLIRRIAMLQNAPQNLGQPLSRSRRYLSAVALIAIASAVVMLRGPARAGEDAKTSDAPKASAPPSTHSDLSEETAFDVSFVSANAPGLIAIRPAATLRRIQSRQALSFLLSDFGGDFTANAKELGIEPPAPGQGELNLDQIDWLILTLGFGKAKAGPSGPAMHRVDMGLETVRTITPYDWLGFLRAWHFPLIPVSVNGHTYYQIKASGALKRLLGEKSQCVYLPDGRTIVFKEEGELVKRLSTATPAIPNFASGIDWERSKRALLAVAINNTFGEISNAYDLARPDDKVVLDLFKNVDHWLFHVEDAESIAVHAHAACNSVCGERIASSAKSLLDMARSSLQARTAKAPTGTTQERAWRMLGGLVQNVRVNDGPLEVDVNSNGFGTLADFGSIMEALAIQQVADSRISRSPTQTANAQDKAKQTNTPR
jgi:beta-lactamase regulating signal transducer with metallopeptidase domain